MTFKFPLYQNAIEQSFLIKYNWFSFSTPASFIHISLREFMCYTFVFLENTKAATTYLHLHQKQHRIITLTP